ncbi:MAG: DUF2723 domain-containing protein [Candidatus Marinimicrobia bacterium]|nr:DUF2723 domain-containing protein [Candidatus Neomarinimicrobiota bacterium]
MTKSRDWIKILLGLFVLLFSFFIYMDTLAPTVSFWDCGEFIATSYSLGVPHPPGSPLYLLIGRVFSMLPFSGGAALDPAMMQDHYHVIAYRVNTISAIVTAFANLFLFLVIVRLVAEYRGRVKNGLDRWIAYTGGLVGALALAFSDSHWFNAVEAEVYSMSIFFTAIVVWLILKWSEKVDEGHVGARYILLISYMMGLAISVHMLNLLAIPFVGLIMYYKLHPQQDGTEFLAHVLSILGVLLVVTLVAVNMIMPDTSAQYLRLSDNQLGSTYMSFALVWLVLAAVAVWGLAQAYKGERRQRYWQHLLVVVGSAGAFIIIYAGIIKGVPKVAEMVAGALDTDRAVKAVSVALVVMGGLMAGLAYLTKLLPRYRNEVRLSLISLFLVLIGYTSYETIFIRSGQNPIIDENDPETTRQAVAYLEREQYGSYPMFYRDRWSQEGKYTSEWDFFWRYQVNHMYIRYFKWQFWGRSGNQADISQLWALPFLLGLAGLGHHFYRDPKRAFSVTALFIMTGLAIIVYLNQDDPQPRERDYSYVGSFFAYAIWIGIGASAVLEKMVEWFKKPKPWMAAATAVLILAVPVNMLVANYDEHDRSGNYVAWEYSYNLLNSCEPNGILFTNGDNDTFPLWYLQEVEGIRKDVRVVNLSLLNTPWYIMQLKTQEPKVKIRLSDDVVRNIGMVPWEEREYYIPGPDSGQISEQSEVYPLNRELGIRFNLKPTIARRQNPNTGKLSGGLKVQDLMILEILQANRWEKPIYFAVTIAPSNKLGLDEYLRMDGQVFKVLPYKVGDAINADVLYDNMINKYRYTNLDDPSVNFPDNVRRLLQNYRSGFLQMVYYYGQQQGDREKALEILQFMDENLPDEVIPNTYAELYLQIAQLYAQYGDSAAARDYLENFFRHGRGRNDIVAVARVAGYWNDIFDDTERAISILLPLTEDNQQNPYVSYELARVYLKNGDLTNAERWVNSLGQLAPNAQETQQLRRQLMRMQTDTAR